MSRRDFFQTSMLGGLASFLPFKGTGWTRAGADEKETIPVQYRTLGKTGMKVSTIGFGAMLTSDPTVVHHAIDLGINYIDTAASYMKGNNEIMVGNVLKTRRKEVFIATKLKLGTEESMLESIQNSLKKLQTEVIDVIQLHGLNSKEKVLNNEYMNLLDKARKKGMVRFVGFSTHDNQVECLQAAIESKFYDVVLVSYNFTSDAALTEAISKTGEAGIGMVAMKTQAVGYQ
ncbi:MAG: aldo/keto reductase [Bacteroidales bacterium]|nr:aldo/keto reductase [Bacteroidales bacterium]